MGSIFKKILPIAAVAAAPFTGGASLLGSIGGIGGTLGTVGSILGAVSSAQSLFGGGGDGGSGSVTNIYETPQQEQQKPVIPQEEAFSPVRPNEATRPESLNEFAGFSPEQERSALATKGLNVGLGQDEEGYYRNLLQRSLIGEGNQVQAGNNNFLMPIESQYFSRGGVNTSDVMQFLKGIRQS